MAHDHSHGHGHGHGHGHSHAHAAGDRRLGWAVAVNLILTLAQLVGGIAAGSLALIADALHNFSDAAALVLALAARRIARRPADDGMTFGYERAEVVAALINYTTLIMLGIWLGYEAVMRFIEPQGVDGWIVVWVAALALVIDLVTALLTMTMAKDSINIRAAFIHNIADALGSVAVIVAGVLILTLDWKLADPIVTVMISVYILWHSLVEIRPAVRILMLGSPPGIETAGVIAALEKVEGVSSVHHAHLWQMQENTASLEAHLVLAEAADPGTVKAEARRVLKELGITHSTLETELLSQACRGAKVVGHRVAS
jgi:cobalt-zinc-cadmium efflux system protein